MANLQRPMDRKKEMASIVRSVIQELLHQQIQIMTLNSSRATGTVSGRFRSGSLVYDYSIKGDDVSYKPVAA